MSANEEYKRYLRKELVALHYSYTQAAAPILRKLAQLEQTELPGMNFIPMSDIDPAIIEALRKP